MTFDDPGGDLFSHLDDPTPPMYAGDALTRVKARGTQLRRRRQMTYAMSSMAVAVIITGAAVSVAATNNSSGPNSTHVATTGTPSPHPDDTRSSRGGKKGDKNHPGSTTTSGVPINGGSGHGGGTHGGKPRKPVKHCTTPPPVTVTTTPTPDPTSTQTHIPITAKSTPPPVCTTTTPTSGPTATATPTSSPT
jgi:hypothetical protein